MEDNVITWKPCYKVGGLVVYVTRYGDLMTIDSRGRLVYKRQETRITSPAYLKTRKSPQQYQNIVIHTPGRRYKLLYVHRLVAGVYCQCPNIFCTEVDHIDGNPKNNRWDNLEWVTPQENVRRYHEKKRKLKIED
jgi:hypothetical protein